MISLRPSAVPYHFVAFCLILTYAGDCAPADEPNAKKKRRRTADVVYVATPHDVVARMLDVAGVSRHDTVYDLGCGDGRIVITAARRFGCRGIGFDIDPERIAECRRNVAAAGVEHLVTFKEENIFDVDLRPATVITLYLLPRMNLALVPQFNQMRPGSRVVSHDFGIEGMTPDHALTMVSKEDGVEHHIYLWTVPLKKKEDASKKTDQSGGVTGTSEEAGARSP